MKAYLASGAFDNAYILGYATLHMLEERDNSSDDEGLLKFKRERPWCSSTPAVNASGVVPGDSSVNSWFHLLRTKPHKLVEMCV